MRKVMVGLLMLLPVVAGASKPLKLKGSTVKIVLEGKRHAGVGLFANGNKGWQLSLAKPSEGTAEIVDVTANSGGTKWVLDVAKDGLRLDSSRFVAGHAYRVMLRQGTTEMGEALFYLYPPKGGKSRVNFSDGDTNATGGLGEMASVPKGAL